MGIKSDLDKFYTKPCIAQNLLQYINIDNYDMVIEPSAGSGAFSNHIQHPNLIAMDLLPENPSIQQQDWFDFSVPEQYKNVLIIGNPPFGKRNKLSQNFIKHALSFENVYTVAFILPNVYNKHTNQKIFPENWHLATSIPLPKDSFTINNESYHVPCTFYVWTKHPVEQDLRFNPKDYHTTDFVITTNKTEADFFVLGASLKTVKAINEVHANNRGYYIKSNIDTEILKQRFQNIQWNKFGNSSANGGVSWFTKIELIKIYEEQKNHL